MKRAPFDYRHGGRSMWVPVESIEGTAYRMALRGYFMDDVEVSGGVAKLWFWRDENGLYSLSERVADATSLARSPGGWERWEG